MPEGGFKAGRLKFTPIHLYPKPDPFHLPTINSSFVISARDVESISSICPQETESPSNENTNNDSVVFIIIWN